MSSESYKVKYEQYTNKDNLQSYYCGCLYTSKENFLFMIFLISLCKSLGLTFSSASSNLFINLIKRHLWSCLIRFCVLLKHFYDIVGFHIFSFCNRVSAIARMNTVVAV